MEYFAFECNAEKTAQFRSKKQNAFIIGEEKFRILTGFDCILKFVTEANGNLLDKIRIPPEEEEEAEDEEEEIASVLTSSYDLSGRWTTDNFDEAALDLCGTSSGAQEDVNMTSGTTNTNDMQQQQQQQQQPSSQPNQPTSNGTNSASNSSASSSDPSSSAGSTAAAGQQPQQQHQYGGYFAGAANGGNENIK